MARSLSPDVRRNLAARIRYYNELGIYDFYRREAASTASPAVVEEPTSQILIQPEQRDEMSLRRSAVAVSSSEESMFEVITPRAESGVADPVKALKLIR